MYQSNYFSLGALDRTEVEPAQNRSDMMIRFIDNDLGGVTICVQPQHAKTLADQLNHALRALSAEAV